MPKHLLFLTICAALCHASAQPSFAGDSSGLRQMADYLLHANSADREALTLSLMPAQNDYYAVFDSAFARKCYAYHRKFRRNYYFEIKPFRSGETIIVVWQAITEELTSYTSNNARHFAGGYRELANKQHLASGALFYRIKFVRPGHELGSGYDAFAFVNGHWKLFLRPWQVLLE